MSRITELKGIIADAYNEIQEIQKLCSHPAPCVTKKYTSNTGNWNPRDDTYTIKLHCELCDKNWEVVASTNTSYKDKTEYEDADRLYTRVIK